MTNLKILLKEKQKIHTVPRSSIPILHFPHNQLWITSCLTLVNQSWFTKLLSDGTYSFCIYPYPVKCSLSSALNLVFGDILHVHVLPQQLFTSLWHADFVSSSRSGLNLAFNHTDSSEVFLHLPQSNQASFQSHITHFITMPSFSLTSHCHKHRHWHTDTGTQVIQSLQPNIQSLQPNIQSLQPNVPVWQPHHNVGLVWDAAGADDCLLL